MPVSKIVHWFQLPVNSFFPNFLRKISFLVKILEFFYHYFQHNSVFIFTPLARLAYFICRLSPRFLSLAVQNWCFLFSCSEPKSLIEKPHFIYSVPRFKVNSVSSDHLFDFHNWILFTFTFISPLLINFEIKISHWFSPFYTYQFSDLNLHYFSLVSLLK